MHNAAAGSPTEVHDKTCILTRTGASGHAVYGPYELLEAGYYAVEFNVSAAEPQRFDSDEICARVDVAAQFGSVILTLQDIALRQLRDGPLCIRLPFHNDLAQRPEFRVHVSGSIPLLIEEYRPVVRFNGADEDYAALLRDAKFPDPDVVATAPFFQQAHMTFRYLYENGAAVKVVGGDIVVTIDGISFYAREDDDLALVREIFLDHTYNFLLEQDCCVIDIGMNIGLVLLMFAAKPFVKEVHSFEPFESTYNRARANLSLNPAIAHKITTHNFGLADKHEETIVHMPEHMQSGSFSLMDAGREAGPPRRIKIRNVAAVLEPIIKAASRKGRRIVAKIDCEGSEYAIFDVLEQHGLLTDISLFMVEWHWIGWQKTRYDLIAPLTRHGFVTVDLNSCGGKERGLRCGEE